ncbi:Hypothetical predicted protein [Mytilus galloprovincialis]|uniref:Sema domain-containing protein n=1 Tax=Mytilus galloprovincialis TaxID=29158 RepID=A0A8B6BUS1_MYTGA|nr:Hypothetical predicted protein [Mytilus galloprovincialis]
MDTVYDIDETITAMDMLQTSNYSVLYFGTRDGRIGRVYLHLGPHYSMYKNYRRPLVSVANSTIVGIKVGKDGVYFITESKINKISIKECSIHENCESCMDSHNSSCGWDYAQNRFINIALDF